MRPRLDASHERMFGEKNSLFGVTAHLDKRRTESFFLQTFFHRSEEHTSELQSRSDIVCRLLLEKKNDQQDQRHCFHDDPTCYADLPGNTLRCLPDRFSTIRQHQAPQVNAALTKDFIITARIQLH